MKFRCWVCGLDDEPTDGGGRCRFCHELWVMQRGVEWARFGNVTVCAGLGMPPELWPRHYPATWWSHGVFVR